MAANLVAARPETSANDSQSSVYAATFGIGPTYLDAGRIRRPPASCSRECAIQPATRPVAKTQVKAEGGKASASRRSAV